MIHCLWPESIPLLAPYTPKDTIHQAGSRQLKVIAIRKATANEHIDELTGSSDYIKGCTIAYMIISRAPVRKVAIGEEKVGL